MASARTRRLLRLAASTDRTFRPAVIDGRQALAGKCIHCNRAIVVALDGSPSSATVEHIVPQTHGGTDDADNLALACAGCNSAKGRHLDHRRRGDPTLERVIATLRERQRARRRSRPRVGG
jgi:5-methylcytosine-specific restriction endonuclease McrA